MFHVVPNYCVLDVLYHFSCKKAGSEYIFISPETGRDRYTGAGLQAVENK